MFKKNVMTVVFAGVLGLCATGCQSGKLSAYLSPQVTGQVLAADTRQPLAGATVRRVVPMPSAGESTQPKGGQLQMAAPGVRAGADGRFTLDAERDLSVIHLFRHGGWHSVAVSFSCNGYVSLRTNFAAATFKERSFEGVPLVNAGDIFLQPKRQ